MAKTMSSSKKAMIGRSFSLLILIFVAAILITPLIWTIATALKPDSEVYINQFFPTNPDFGNFARAIQSGPFALYLKNTLIYVLLDVSGVVISSLLVAYGFSRFEFKGKRVWFLILLATMMLPTQITMVPKFLMFRQIGWVNSYLPMIVPRWFATNAFGVFLVRQYMSSLPKTFDEAAVIDGASTFRVLCSIILPMSKAVITALTVFTFIGTWSDFQNPLIYIYDSDKYPISLGLSFFKGLYKTQFNLLMAATLMSILPILILFFVFQKYIIEGVSISSGTKG